MNYALFLKQRLVSFLALFTAAVLLLGLARSCDDDTGSGSYNPGGGDTMWHPKRK